MSDAIILTCSSCGAKNRVPMERLDDNPVCGRCKSSLPAGLMARVSHVNDSTFDREVMGASLPVLVDCWAPWCGPCQAVGPVMDELARLYAGRLRVVKLNLDENPGVGSRFRITSVPYLMLVKNGQVVNTLVGAQPREILEKAIEQIV